jgi:hypothetical protein
MLSSLSRGPMSWQAHSARLKVRLRIRLGIRLGIRLKPTGARRLTARMGR